MDDDDFMPDFDPYDMLQEHNLLINRLINAHNANDKLIQALAKHNTDLSSQTLAQDRRIRALEQDLRNLKKVINAMAK